MKGPVYLDYNATTPVDPTVVIVVNRWLREEFGNPSSTHLCGQRARAAVDEARADVAALLSAQPDEIIFTACATEANNLALLGVAAALPDKRHVVISAVEHPAVAQPARRLREAGWEVSVIPVDATGSVAVSDVASALRADTALVSIMHANNEVGTIQPVREIARLARGRGVLVHTDAAQSVGKVRVVVEDLGVDLLTIAGHKFYGPKGVGALYVRRQTPIKAILFGGEQERGLRPGTENVALIAGLGAACRLARERLGASTIHLQAMRDRLHDALAASVPGLERNGHPTNTLPNTLHVSFPGISGPDLLEESSDVVAASTGSACHAGSINISGVLAAMGLDQARAQGAIRLSVGLPTTEGDIDIASAALIKSWKRLTVDRRHRA